MAEYIDREKAKSLLHIEYAYAAEQLLDEIPVADVATVVRCKDCRKFKTYACRMVASGYDDFCSYGERNEGAANG